MESMGGISESAAAGILGDSETNQTSTPPESLAKADDAPSNIQNLTLPHSAPNVTRHPTRHMGIYTSRLRKVRCDSGRPICKNCTRRSESCEYDVAPRRRGPDRQPGTRHRLYRKKPEDATPPPKRTGKSTKESGSGPHQLRGSQRGAKRRTAVKPPVAKVTAGGLRRDSPSPSTGVSTRFGSLRRVTDLSHPACDDRDLDATLRAVGFESIERLLRITKDEVSATTPGICPPVGLVRHQKWTTGLSPWHAPGVGVYTTSTDEHLIGLLNSETYIPRGPSSSFHKQTWWDSLLSLYSEDPSQSALNVFQDLNFVLNNAIYWLSFINYRRFMDNLYDPGARIFVQPSLVLSALALSTLMKSSETGLGEEGRRFALWLRDAAQSSLDASINASWIEPSLAQATFFLALFEANSHPTHSVARTSSAIFLLDSLIQALSLTTIDAHEPTVSTFRANEIPQVVPPPTRTSIPPPYSGYSRPTEALQESKCTCGNTIPSIFEPTSKGMRLTAQNSKSDDPGSSHEQATPEFHLGNSKKTTSWPDLSDFVEVQKEESRRLCWSSMMLISALREYTPLYFDLSAWDLHVTKHENFALFFPGEKTCTTNPKESIWAIHSRAAILWNYCQQLCSRPKWDYRRDELAGRAWMETNAIEEALEQHQCPEGHGIPYAGREYVLQLKLLISNQFTRSIPLPHTLGQERNNAKEWLLHRAVIAGHIRKLAYFVARFGATIASLALAKRPLSIWWGMYQIKAGLQLWRSDPSLTDALEQSLEFVAVVDFLSVMWPSEPQRRHYDALRNDLIQCCVSSGIRVPAAVPIPGLPPDMYGTMIPSPSLTREASAADILMAPLD